MSAVVDLTSVFLLRFSDCDLTYLIKYLDIVDRGCKNTYSHTDYTEKHHILPVCVFPEYRDIKKYPWNCVRLPYKSHFIAHYYLHKAIPNNFKLAWAWDKMWSNSNLLERELPEELVAEYLADRVHLRTVHNTMKGKKHTEETKRKIALASTGKAYCKGKKLTQEHKDKISAGCRGVKKSEETRRRMSESLKVRVCKEETKQKLVARNKERVVSEETRAKMRDSSPHNKPFAGRKHTEETKAKIALAAKRPRKKRNPDLAILSID